MLNNDCLIADFSKTFSIFVKSGISGKTYFDESVSLLSLDGNLVNFNESRRAINTHHLYWYVVFYPILYKCGVLFI